MRYHEFAREHGVNKLLYMIVRCLLVPAFLVWFRLERQGREHARVKGGLIVASNHRSFLDPFVIGALLPWRRQIQFVAKVELFENRWQGWILSRLGAFPIRRGQSDETAMETAALAVDRGGDRRDLPRGHPDPPRLPCRPKRGVGRLALETGAPVLPVAVIGSEHVRRGWRIRPAQGAAAGRNPDDVPAHREAVAEPRRDRHGPDLAEHRAAVGVPGRPAAAAQGGRDRRRQLGNRGCGPARPRRARRPARHALRREGRRDPAEARERGATSRRSGCRTRSR